MSSVKIIGKPGSRSRRVIINEAGIPLFKRLSTADVVVNYGLAGRSLEEKVRRIPSLKRTPMLNRRCGLNKYSAVKAVERAGVPVPESVKSLGVLSKKKVWLQKPFRSIGGKGIKIATTKNSSAKYYYQKFVNDRRFELRVHAFSWLDEKEWSVQKRLGDKDEVTWNYKTGGRFQNVRHVTRYKVFQEAVKLSRKVLEALNMDFGAVDFIVDNDMNIYFIEINSAPGLTEFSQGIYINAFKKLAEMPVKKITQLVR